MHYDTVLLKCRGERKKEHGVFIVPKDTTTISELETKKNEMFLWEHLEDAKAEGARLVKEADFEAEKFFLPKQML